MSYAVKKILDLCDQFRGTKLFLPITNRQFFPLKKPLTKEKFSVITKLPQEPPGSPTNVLSFLKKDHFVLQKGGILTWRRRAINFEP